METPLQLAVDKRSVTITELLLNHGAQVNAANSNGDTSLHTAVANHSLSNTVSPTDRSEVCEPFFHSYNANSSCIVETISLSIGPSFMNT